jgi:Xaa-Pro aminopeptidase
MNDELVLAIEPPVSADTLPPTATRKQEVDAKQRQIEQLLTESQCEAILLFDPANLAWLTGASICQGISDAAEWPAVFLTGEQRWLLAGSADTQRIFDVHLDALGFQLKEWPWHWGREQLLADIVQNRKMACDKVLANSTPLGPAFRRIRLTLTSPERDRLKTLGRVVAHALEATCRNLQVGQSEFEIAGEIAHRLLKHGATPIALHVAADDRGQRHPRPGVTAAKVQKCCTLSATAQRHGLHATAARTVAFQPDANRETQHAAASQIVAALASATKPGKALADIFESGRQAAEHNNVEPDWFRSHTGHVTGWLPVERPIAPTMKYNFDANWAVVWQAGVGSAFVADTFLIDDGAQSVTPAESWPIRRIKIGNNSFDIPDMLIRQE